MKDILKDIKGHVLTGVSYMIPAVTVGGIGIALALAIGGQAVAGEGMVIPLDSFWKNIEIIGAAAIGFMVPLLAGYISYSIAGRPGLLPGLAVGALANQGLGTNSVSTGFLGGMVLGLAAGYLAKWVKGWKVPSWLKPIMPILVIPFITTFAVGLLYILVLVNPLGTLTTSITSWLSNLSSGSTVVLAIAIGCMIAFDMGGPINKIAFATGVALIAEGNTFFMGMAGVAICIPPIGMGLATIIAKKKFSPEERDSGTSALAMGFIGITEGAIPFAAADPIHVLPSIMIGSSVGAIIAGLGNATNAAPHGGLIVLPVVGEALYYILGVIVGSLVVVGLIMLLKKDYVEPQA